MENNPHPTNQDSKSNESSSSPSTADTSSTQPPTARTMVPATIRTGFQVALTEKDHMAIKVKSVLRKGERCRDDMADLMDAIAMRLAGARAKLGDHTLAIEIEQFFVICGIYVMLIGDLLECLEDWESCEWDEKNFRVLREELEDRLVIERDLRALYQKAVDLGPWNAKQREDMVKVIRLCTGFDDDDEDEDKDEDEDEDEDDGKASGPDTG